MFLYCAQLSRADERIAIFVGKIGRDLNIQIDLVDHVSEWVAFHMLYDADAVSGNVPLLAEAKHVDACAGSNGRKEACEGSRRAGHGGLVGRDGELTEVGVHTGAAGEVDDHFHEIYYSLIFLIVVE